MTWVRKIDKATMVGKKFGMLIVLSVWGDVAGRTTIVCKCDCGGKWYGNFDSKVFLPNSCGCKHQK